MWHRKTQELPPCHACKGQSQSSARASRVCAPACLHCMLYAFIWLKRKKELVSAGLGCLHEPQSRRASSRPDVAMTNCEEAGSNSTSSLYANVVRCLSLYFVPALLPQESVLAPAGICSCGLRHVQAGPTGGHVVVTLPPCPTVIQSP